MVLDEWAKAWNIPPEAVADLRRHIIAEDCAPLAKGGASEGAVQAEIRLEAAGRGIPLWRNNVGALFDRDDRLVRYGLCNESKAINERIKSSDLIGVRPVLIEPYMVGRVIGQFIARETKERTWQYKGTKREQAQLKFIEIVNGLGGDGKFANGLGTF